MVKSMVLFILFLSLSAGATEIVNLFEPADLAAAKNLQNLHGVGTLEMAGLAGEIEIFFASPDKFFMKVDLGILKISQGFDGSTAWVLDQNGQVLELAGAEKRQVFNSAYLFGWSYLLNDRMPGQINFIGDSTIDNVSYAAFLARPQNGDSLGLFINKKSKRLEIYREWLDDVIVVTWCSDFRNVSGINLPFVYDSRANLPQLNSKMVFKSLEINIPMDTGLFSIHKEERVDYSFPNGVDSLLVPFKMVNGHILLKATINDGKKSTVLLDSGAGTNVLIAEYARQIGLEISGELPSKGVAGYGEAALTKIDSINVEGALLFDQVAAVIDLGSFPLNYPEDFIGILGHDLLARFPMKIDYAAEIITLYNPKTFTPPAAEYGLGFDYFMKIPLVKATYAGHEGNFIVDLGNALGLILHNPFVEKYNLKETFTDIKKLENKISGVGGASEAFAAVGATFILGPVSIDKPPLIVAESDAGITGSVVVDGNIGNLVLKEFVLVLNYADKKIYILPAEK